MGFPRVLAINPFCIGVSGMMLSTVCPAGKVLNTKPSAWGDSCVERKIDDSNVGIEYQVTEMVKNQMRHNMALTIMTNQMKLLETAIAGRIS